MTPADLEDFIKQARELGARRLVLRHMQFDSRTGHSAFVPLMAWDLERGDATRMLLADSILECARKDADDTPGSQTYSLFAIIDGEDVVQKRWTMAGEKLINHGAGPTEAPNPTGALALQMRHTESLFRVVESLVSRCQKTQNHQIDKLQAANERYAEREIAVIQKYEELATEEHARKIELTTVTQQLEQKGKALALIEPVVPMLLSKLFKTPLAPSDSPINTLDALLSSVTPQQAEQLAQVLDAGQMTVLEALFKERSEAQRVKDAAAEKAAATKAAKESTHKPGSTNGAPAA